MYLLRIARRKRVGEGSQAETNAKPQPTPLPFYLTLFLFLFSVYLLTYSPRFHSSDGLAMFATAESLARRGEWDADQVRWMGEQQGILGLDGRLYIRKGVGMSLLALPLVWLGLAFPFWGAATTVLLFNALITAATATLVLGYLRALRYDPRVSLAAALTFGLATLAWPYAKTFFSDPLAGLCLIAAALALLSFRLTGRATHAFWAGFALAVAVAVRYANGVVIPLFGLILVKYQMVDVQTNLAARQSARDQARMSRARPQFSSLVKIWLAFGLPLLAAASAIGLYNLARYGNPLNTGYLPEENFGGIWWQGIAGLLVSPGRGLFLYAPVLLLAVPSAPAFVRRHRSEAALAGAVILIHVLLYGKWFMWHGGFAWGPRFMVPTLPFFVILMTPALEWTMERRVRRLFFLGLAALSALMQVLGLSIHFELFQTRLLDTGLALFAPITFFAPRYSPLLGQFQFLRMEYLDFAWVADGGVHWPLLAALFSAIVVSGWSLACSTRYWPSRKNDKFKSSRSPGPRACLPFGDRPFFLYVSPALGVLAVTIWLLARAHTLHPSDLRDAVAVLNEYTTASDALVTGTPEETVAFADLYKGRADVLGLSDGSPVDADVAASLAEMAKRHPVVWWVPGWLPAGESTVETWLMRRGFRADDRAVGSRRMAMYYFPPQSLMETAIGVTFGDAIILDEVHTSPTTRPGGVLPVVLIWEARQPVQEDYYVFVHLLDTYGNRVAQSDGQPALWTRSTSGWGVGERIEDRHAVWLPADLPAGVYTLWAGLYRPENSERLPTADGKTSVPLGVIHNQD